MSKTAWYSVLTLGMYSLAKLYVNRGLAKQKRYINKFEFPLTVNKNIAAKYPHLSDADVAEVIRGLREYFHISLLARKRQVSMPSQVVDVAWHEFILFTKQYQQFCDIAFNRFLHHQPAESMTSPTIAQQGIKRAWSLSCAREGINQAAPHTLPILFAIDAKLKIPDGFFYKKDCKTSTSDQSSGNEFCATHIGCAGGCANGVTSCINNPSSCSGGCGGD